MRKEKQNCSCTLTVGKRSCNTRNIITCRPTHVYCTATRLFLKARQEHWQDYDYNYDDDDYCDNANCEDDYSHE